MSTTLRIATRGSPLAWAQTVQTVELLKRIEPSIKFEIIKFKTTADRFVKKPLRAFRGIGVFVKELRQALLEDRADIALHSLKDVPAEEHPYLVLASFPPREIAYDVLITRNYKTLNNLDKDSTIGTASMRRIVQLKALRADLKFAEIRGNIQTRLAKLERGDYDAIVLAAAALRRLGIELPNAYPLPISKCIPAAGQGILVLECRRDDRISNEISALIDDKPTRIAALTERAFLQHIGGGCSMPIAVHARAKHNSLDVAAMIADPVSNKTAWLSHEFNHTLWRDAADELATMMRQKCKEENINII